jgi:hypothetical protein
MDTHDGPYSEIEHQALFSSLESAHSQCRISTEDYLLAWLFLALGHRPIQYACLKVRDVFTAPDDDGNAAYFLNVLRAKQRYSPVRSLFKTRALTPSFGILLTQHANEIRSRFDTLFDHPAEAPLFPTPHTSNNAPDGFRFHRSAGDIARDIRSILSRLASPPRGQESSYTRQRCVVGESWGREQRVKDMECLWSQSFWTTLTHRVPEYT